MSPICFFSKACRSIVLCIVIFCAFAIPIHSQTTLFTQGFEGDFPPAGWSIQNHTPNSNSWNQYSWEKNSGAYCAAVFPNVANANAWLYTAALNLEAGKYYALNYYIKIFEDTRFKITLNRQPQYGEEIKTLRNSLTPAASFVLLKDTFACEVSGTYYIGFNNNSVSEYSAGFLIDDISFVRLAPPGCTSVSAGTITSSVNTICAGTSFSLTNNNATTGAAGIRYAWQRSEDGINWSNITNGYTYNSSIQVTQTASSYYRFVDTCLASGNSHISNQVLVSLTPFTNCYCTPAASNCSGLAFTNVSFVNSTINNSSACSPNGYGNYAALGTVNAYRGQGLTVQHTITAGFTGPYSVGIWIDLDHNGAFTQEEFVVNHNQTGASSSTQFNIPANATTGETRVRVKVRPYYNPNMMTWAEACNMAVPGTGEVEDYKLVINDLPGCSGVVTAGTISAISQICPNTAFNINVTGATVNQGGMRYAWQRSADNVNWVNISNTSYVIYSLSTGINSTSYFRLTDTCLASGSTSISNVITVNTNSILSCYCTPATSNCSSQGIDSVSFNTLRSGPTGCSTNGYGNFTALSTSINNGSHADLYIKFRNPTATKYLHAWIDFNRNGQFEETEKIVNANTTSSFFTGVVTIPFQVNPGETVLRIMVINTTITPTSCSTPLGTGEVEDYKVILNTPNPVSNKFNYYVKQTAAGLNDGSSWANAFTSLTNALAIAQPGDTVKVAKGIYVPGTSNSSRFELRDSIIVMGGYPDTGNPTNADRDFSTHLTVLSGEIGSAAVDNNVGTILLANSKKGFVVDGFIIENGYCYVEERGNIYVINSTGTIRNTVIRNNYGFSSGVIYARASSLTLVNSFLERNNTGVGQTAVINAVSKSEISLLNCVVSKNNAAYTINQHYSTGKIVNSTFFKNAGYTNVHDTSRLDIQNSIFYYNGGDKLAEDEEIRKDVYSYLKMDNTITEFYGYLTSDFTKQAPRFTDTARIAGADGKYFTADDGLRLVNPCSPAINMGNNAFASSLSTDIAGNERVKNGIVDIGAYEVQESIASQRPVIYVNKKATGLNTGLSWQDAYTDLQSAFYACSDTIRVAKGVYPVSTTDPKAYYQLSNNRVVIGGFPDSGSPANAAFDPVLNPTIIDGVVGAGVKSYSIIVSRNNDSTSRLIGFEIRNAIQPLEFFPVQAGAIKISHKSSARFEKIKIGCSTNNIQSILLIYGKSTPEFLQSSFHNVYSGDPSGYSRWIRIMDGSKPVFRKCYTGRDTTVSNEPVRSGIFTIANAGAVFDSCTFYKATDNAIFLENSDVLIQHCTFNKTLGRSVTSNASTVLVRKTVFNDSTYYTDFNGGTIGNYDNSNFVMEDCRFNDSYTFFYGAAFFNKNSTALFRRCVFTDLKSSAGSALYSQGGTQTFLNCVFNQAGAKASAAPFIGGENNSHTTVINSTLIGQTNNSAPIISSTANSTIKFYNSVVWRYGNTGLINSAPNDIYVTNINDPGVCDIRNSILYKQTNTNYLNTVVGQDPKFVDLSNRLGVDSIIATADDGIRPCDCSYAINHGDNNLSPESIDIAGNNRVKNGTIDIGAYEINASATTDRTFYVKQNAAPNGNGLSWATAYTDLQSAVQNSCADTIKVAKGIYKPAIASKDSTFDVYRGITMLGSYPDTGNPSDNDRSIHHTPSILSGDIGVAGDSTDNSYTVMKVHCPDSTVILDGLIFERGNNTIDEQYGGGGIQAIGSRNLLINNCIVRNNYAKRAGGLFTRGCYLTVSKTVISDNNATWGGGFFISDYFTYVGGFVPLPYYIVFRNSVITGNQGSGGIVSEGGSPSLVAPKLFENTVFYKNSGPAAGALSTYNTNIDIRNCDFVKNNINGYGPGTAIGIANNYIQPSLGVTVYNSVFYGNTANGLPPQTVNPDFYWANGSSQSYNIPSANLNYSALGAYIQGGGWYNFYTENNTFRDVNDGDGPDNIWMTADDGLRLSTCAKSVDAGSNNYSSVSASDIIDSARIQNNRVDIGAYEVPSFMVKIIATDTAACPGTNVTFTATASNAGPAPVYQWTVNDVNVGSNTSTFSSATLSNNDKVMVKVKTSNCNVNDTAYSNIINMQIGSSLMPSAIITASDTTACAGTPVTFTAAATQSNAASTYQWTVNNVNTGTSSPTFITSSLSDGDVVKVVVTINGTCLATQTAVSNNIKMNVKQVLAPSVTISSSSNPACAGSVIQFVATAANAGSLPSYQWKVNGINVGGNTATYSSATIPHNASVSVVVTSSETCTSAASAPSNVIVQQVSTAIQPSVAVVSSPVTCPGSPITFTASITNGGANPVLEWKVNGEFNGATGTSFVSATLKEGDVVEARLTSNAPCVASITTSSTPVVINYTSAVMPSVSIAASATTICAGVPVTFTATSNNGGSTPSYRWFVNNIQMSDNGAVFVSNTLNNGAVVKVSLTSSANCVLNPVVTSNSITINVGSASAPSVTISSNQAAVCSGGTITFTATSTNAGTSPSFQWKRNGANVGTGITYSSGSLLNGDLISCIMTASSGCTGTSVVTSNSIAVAFAAAPSTPSISAVGNLLATTQGLAAYQWYLNNVPIAGATSYVHTPTTSGLYKVEVTNAAGCKALSNDFNLVITSVSNVTVNGVSVNCFPNPTSNILNIKFSSQPVGSVSMQLTDNTGRVILKKELRNQTETIDLSGVVTGIYLLNISGKKDQVVLKVEVVR